MRCTFEDCNAELHKKTRSGFCSRHRRVIYTRKWSAEHKEYFAERYQQDKSKIRARLDAISREQKSLKNKKWYEKNKEHAKQVSAQWAKNNPHKRAATFAKYRATKLQAIPKWLSDSQLKAIESIYKSCPVGYEVDHMVPLQGKEVRGLHVPWNLQYLTVSDNRQKSNKAGK
jgi:hypothetical protein